MSKNENRVFESPSLLTYYDFDVGAGLTKQAPTAFDYWPVKLAAGSVSDAVSLFSRLFGISPARVVRVHHFSIKSRNGVTLVQFQRQKVTEMLPENG